jgi:hypothetical protein
MEPKINFGDLPSYLTYGGVSTLWFYLCLGLEKVERSPYLIMGLRE